MIQRLATMRYSTIAFTSDFGLEDHYVSVVKFVIKRLSNGEVDVIDVSHSLGRHNLYRGAYVSAVAAKYAPQDTLHLIVVDPTVGTKRDIVVFETERNGVFIAPDNGVLTHAYEWFSGTGYLADLRSVVGKDVSSTFHGRDVFAPLAVKVAMGVEPSSLGRGVDPDDLKRLKLTRPNLRKGAVTCSVLNVDVFGNVITNIPNHTLNQDSYVVQSSRGAFKLAKSQTYASLQADSLLLINGSEGFYEIALNGKPAAALIGAEPGSELSVYED
ncbi:MAG: SAM-dependent chlorinase/fluorinase [Candidatus Marsarchaeota archaeon]|nr:SAM-dependent chlorinase/fluorinase [Candidatus Marsarchaeota archaeon]